MRILSNIDSSGNKLPLFELYNPVRDLVLVKNW